MWLGRNWNLVGICRRRLAILDSYVISRAPVCQVVDLHPRGVDSEFILPISFSYQPNIISARPELGRFGARYSASVILCHITSSFDGIRIDQHRCIRVRLTSKDICALLDRNISSMSKEKVDRTSRWWVSPFGSLIMSADSVTDAVVLYHLSATDNPFYLLLWPS